MNRENNAYALNSLFYYDTQCNQNKLEDILFIFLKYLLIDFEYYIFSIFINYL